MLKSYIRPNLVIISVISPCLHAGTTAFLWVRSTTGVLLASLDLRQELVDQKRLLGDQTCELTHLTDWRGERINYYSLNISISQFLNKYHHILKSDQRELGNS